MNFKATGTQNATISFSGAGEIGVGTIITTDTAHFVLENEGACERKYNSSKPSCTFQVRLYKYASGLSALVHAETEVGHLEIHLTTS